MDWNTSIYPRIQYTNEESSIEGDFELFASSKKAAEVCNHPSLVEAYNHHINIFGASHLFDGRLIAATPTLYGHHLANMTSSYGDQDHRSTWYRPYFVQDMSASSEAVRSTHDTTSSVVDSGYGSIDYTHHIDIIMDQAVQAGSIEDSIFQQDTNFCELCLEKSGKKKYFNNNADKRKHVLTHTRPFKCDVSACNRRYGFSSPHDLARHKKSCHSVLDPKSSKIYYRCAAPACRKKDKVWPRKDNFKAHLEGTHKYSESKVVEMLKRSECIPGSKVRLDSRVRQKVKRRKSEDVYALQEVSQDYYSFDSAMSEDEKQPTRSLMLTQPLDAMILQQPMYIKPGTRVAPEIVVFNETNYENESGYSSPTSNVDMMEVCENPAERSDSPFIMLQPPSPSQQSNIDQTQAPFTPTTDSDSVLETDWDDITTDTELDFELYEVQTAFQPLIHVAVQQILRTYNHQRSPNANANRQPSSTQSFNSGTHLQANASGSNNPTRSSFDSKRARNAGDDEDDGNDERPPRRKNKTVKTEEDLLPLACPFNKHDPYKHDKCYTFVLKGISRVKQHLERNHSIPIHCPKCYTKFQKHDARDKHVRQSTCENLPERTLEGITEAQMRLLKRRTTGKTVQESWYSIFELLFPEARKPASPFMDSSLSAELSSFRDFTRREGRDIVAAVIHDFRTEHTPFAPSHPDFEDFARQVFLSGTERLFRMWQERARVVSPRFSEVTTAGVPPPTPPSTRIPDLPEVGGSVSTEDVPLEDFWREGVGLFGEVDMGLGLRGAAGMDEFSEIGGWMGDLGQNLHDGLGGLT